MSSIDQLNVRVLGGPTAFIEYGGLRLLTDPTFDEPGEYLPGLTKTAAAAVTPAELGPIDAVLLSHDEHPDNLDHSGRALLATVPVTVTTPGGATRLGGTAVGLKPWETTKLSGHVTVTAVPALHGPESAGVAAVEAVAGEVTGFVLTGDGLPTVYVSGDNASLDAVRLIAARFGPVHTAVLFAGAPRLPIFDGQLLVLDSAGAASAAQILDARWVVPVHCDSWSHFTEGIDDIKSAFAAVGLADRLQLP
jgi:L-ascorbate metabolism protein UlaG (beta-lactamase superfamily)